MKKTDSSTMGRLEEKYKAGLFQSALIEIISIENLDFDIREQAEGLLARLNNIENLFTTKGTIKEESYILERSRINVGLRKLINNLKTFQIPSTDEDNILPVGLSDKTSQGQDIDSEVSGNERKLFFAKYGLIPIFAMPILLLFAVVGFHFGMEFPLFLTLRVPFAIVSAICVVWYIYLEQYARSTFETTEILPSPQKYWQFRFNQLVTKCEISKNPKIKIVVLYESRSIKKADDNFNPQLIAEDIEQNFLSIETTVEIIRFDCSWKEEAELKSILFGDQNIYGIYLIHTSDIEDLKYPIKLCQKWANENTEKPIIRVYISGKNKKLNFPIEEKEDATIGVWGLFSRARKRSESWKNQAFIHRYFAKIIFWSFAIPFTLIIGYSTIIKNMYLTQLRSRDQPITSQKNNDLKQELKPLVDLYKNNIDTLVLSKGYVSELKNLSKFFIEDIVKSQGLVFRDDEYKLSLWQEHSDTIFEYAWSRNAERICFCPDNQSVVGCAYANIEHFILWKDEFKNNEPACWNYEGVVKGYWNSNSKTIKIRENDECSFKVDKPMTGLLCFSDGKNGLCIDTRGKADTNFLSSQATRTKLQSLLMILRLISPRSVFSNCDRSSCEEE